MPDYIPHSDADKILWLNNFAGWLTANGSLRGFYPEEIVAMNTLAANASTSWANHNAQQAAAHTATVAKNMNIAAAIELARQDAMRLQSNPHVTDADRAAAGITVRDETPSEGGGGAGGDILTIAPPLLLLDFSIRRQVTVHWGPNPSNEHENARPAIALGCQIQAARGGIPADESLWVPLDIDTDSPYVHVVTETTPTTYAYRARYVNRKLKYGPFGDPAVCTVSV